jgi:hypothetical protein
MACSDGDTLQTMAMNMTPESFPSGDRLWLLKWSVMNSRFSKQMVSPQASLTLKKKMASVVMVGLGRMNHHNF